MSASERPGNAVAEPEFAAFNGLATLGPGGVALRSGLEERFLGWATDCGARQAIFPSLMSVQALDRLDYFQNFPHLALLASGITLDAIEDHYAGSTGVSSIPSEHVEPAGYALPSAACFNVYLSMAGERLDSPHLVTTAANCFRREKHFDEGRLLGFYMREIVCLGEREAVLAHLASFKKRILDFAASIGLPLRVVPSSDPFFDPGGPRGLMQHLFPTKEEFVYGGGDRELAIGSLNFHRNFFGDRCGISVGDGSAAFSSCVAFGLERWIWSLLNHFEEKPGAICRRIAAA